MPVPTWAEDARQRAVTAQQALRASEFTVADRVSESALRLNRVNERLDESGRRVSRGSDRRHTSADPFAATFTVGRPAESAPVRRLVARET